MSAIVIGASSGLGRALAEELARCRHDLLLVASDPRDLEALAADLKLRHEVDVNTIALDFGREADPGARIAAALDGLSAPDALLLPIGHSRRDDDLSIGAAEIGQLLAINLHAPLAIVQALLPRLLETRGTIVLFGSIAGVRGRGRNVVYASAKRALVSLYESLRQRYRPDELRVQLYQLGFLATNLTHGMALPTAPVAPARVAKTVVARLRQGSSLRYLPVKFALIALIVRALPWPLYRRMKD
ncbi:MAG TPA: SDR family NAD(P)-dependent oxidoreductase [Dokdonella sp.]